MAVPHDRRKGPPTSHDIDSLARAVRGLNMTMVRMDERLAKALDEQRAQHREFTAAVLKEIKAAMAPRKADDE